MCYTFHGNEIFRVFLAFGLASAGLAQIFTRARLVRVPVGWARMAAQFDAYERAFRSFCMAGHRSRERAKAHQT